MSTPAKKNQDVSPFEHLGFIVKTLRGSHGCPWDQKQTPKSLKKYLIEEAGELVEAIEQGDPKHICEEAGDLYFILAILTAIFEERHEFSANEALNSICEKMIRRHPHVFEQHPDCTEEELRSQWQRIKDEEIKTKG